MLATGLARSWSTRPAFATMLGHHPDTVMLTETTGLQRCLSGLSDPATWLCLRTARRRQSNRLAGGHAEGFRSATVISETLFFRATTDTSDRRHRRHRA